MQYCTTLTRTQAPTKNSRTAAIFYVAFYNLALLLQSEANENWNQPLNIADNVGAYCEILGRHRKCEKNIVCALVEAFRGATGSRPSYWGDRRPGGTPLLNKTLAKLVFQSGQNYNQNETFGDVFSVL